MILCRLFIGFSDYQSDMFTKIGDRQTVYVIDELAMKGQDKYNNKLHQRPKAYEKDGTTPSAIIIGEFDSRSNYGPAQFLDTLVKPITLQEHFGSTTIFSFVSDDNKSAITKLMEFADNWRVAVNVPSNSTSIPAGATGVLVPKAYGKNTPHPTTQITTSMTKDF